MSDNKEHTMQGGVDWELRTAEDAMVVAPGGGKELALAMRRHADGVRNMMVSELVPSFENAIDRMMEQRVLQVLTSVQQSLDRMTGLVQQVVNDHKELRRDQKKQGKDIAALQLASLAHASRLDDQDERYGALLHGALARIEALEAEKARLEAIDIALAQLMARIGGALPTEEDQGISAQLRADEAGRHGDG